MTAYFTIFGVLLLTYVVLRVLIWWQFKLLPELPQESEPCDLPTTVIDVAPLSERVEAVRQDFATEAHAHAPSFKKPLMVEDRRREIAKLAFFQKPPELPEEEHGYGLLLA